MFRTSKNEEIMAGCGPCFCRDTYWEEKEYYRKSSIKEPCLFYGNTCQKLKRYYIKVKTEWIWFKKIGNEQFINKKQKDDRTREKDRKKMKRRKETWTLLTKHKKRKKKLPFFGKIDKT